MRGASVDRSGRYALGMGSGEPRLLTTAQRMELTRRTWGRRKFVRPRGRAPAELTPSELARVEAWMRPGQASTLGFLSPEQSLMSLVEEDSATLARIGVTHERIANRLAFLMDRSSWTSSVRTRWCALLDRFRVHRIHYAGYQRCAFSEGPRDCGRCSSEYEILNLATGESFWATGLHPHLIGEHRFFEGGSYRLDPEQAARVLELSPGESDLIAKTVTVESAWLFGSCRCEWHGYLWRADDVRELMETGRRFELTPGLHAYVRGDFGFVCAPQKVVLDDRIDLDGATLDAGSFSGGQEIFRGERDVERWDEAQIERLTKALRTSSGRRKVRAPSEPPWHGE